MPAAPPPFELSGGCLCLDFANTWGDRERPATDLLQSLDQVLAFARQTGLLAQEDVDALTALARKDPAAAQGALVRARELREAIYSLCSDQAAGRPPGAGPLRAFNLALAEALPHLRLQAEAEGYGWGWEGTRTSLTAPLWPILRSAAELLASPDLVRLRECGGTQCNWLFLDRSRAGTRRWCSMTSCGNRAKARRHYHKGSA